MTIYNQDCITGMAEKLQPDSIDLCVTSIPFGALFMYSGKPEDIGNNHDGIDMEATHFGLHLRFFIEQLFRVMKPGTNACIHIQQLLTTKVQHGYMGRRDFRGSVIEQFSKGGFEWKGEIVIRKNPQAIAQRQKLHSLLFITGKHNGRDLAPCVNDYVMIFQKPGEATPVPCIYDRLENPHGWVTTEEWIRDAHGVWTDIREMDVLEGWKTVREDDDEKHVCPLQLEVIRRLVKLYTNIREIVLDPFMGIGSTGYVAVELKRKTIGFELKESYYRQAVRNIEKAGESANIDQYKMELTEVK
jgi:DNA modification methylase